MHLVCTILADDATISEPQKRDKIIEFEQQFEYRRSSFTEAPDPVDIDDEITEITLAIRTTEDGRTPASIIQAEVLVDGSPVGIVRRERIGANKGDLETLSITLIEPLSVLLCRDLSFDVILDTKGESWTFNLSSVMITTQKEHRLFNLFEPMGPIRLHDNHRAQNFNIHVDGCRQQRL
jgi:hypothetical protein